MTIMLGVKVTVGLFMVVVKSRWGLVGIGVFVGMKSSGSR